MLQSLSPHADHVPAYPRLVGDVGGTHARFAWQAAQGSELEQVQVLACAEHPSLEDAIRTYLDRCNLPVPGCASLGMATAVTSDQVSMTNHHWAFSIQHLRERLGLQRLVVVNDFTALALALPMLSESDLRPVGGGAAVHGMPVALLGAGTGLGVSGLLPTQDGGWVPLSGEGGHVTLSASTPMEFALIQVLQRRYEHVSAERVLSGQGLVDLHAAFAEVLDRPSMTLSSPAQVVQQGLADPASLASVTLDFFCAFLGSVAGDLALTLGARGGVYIGGGLVPRLGERFAASPFRERFEAKGRFRNFLRGLPVWVIDAKVSPALLGAGAVLDRPGVQSV